MKKIGKFKKGAASFYIVAISTLILVIIAASFAAVIISEVTRTSNDDLAQSAYDSALAGVEDAKLAYYNYQKCKESGASGKNITVNVEDGVSCEEIVALVEQANTQANEGGEELNCDMVAQILGRKYKDENNNAVGVLVQESSGAANNMQQYYTCTTLTTERYDVVDELNGNNPTKVIRAKFADGVGADQITGIKVSWQLTDRLTSVKTNNFSGDGGIFEKESSLPPVISVGLVQTGSEFSLDSFEKTVGNQTNRGMVYLVPTDGDVQDSDYYSKEAIASRHITSEVGKGFLKSNDKVTRNLPYAINCEGSGDQVYACSAIIDLPAPIGGGGRNNDTFIVTLSLPYASTSTKVSLEYLCNEGACPGPEEGTADGKKTYSVVKTKDTQITIDSTGRANDLYRRVETILEPSETAFPYPLYAIELLGTDENGFSLVKDLSPTCEWNLGDATGPKGLCKDTD